LFFLEQVMANNSSTLRSAKISTKIKFIESEKNERITRTLNPR
jgi:hypothetical protein